MQLSDIKPLPIVESEDENKDVSKAPAPGKTGELITVKQAAKIMDISPGRVRQLIQDGRLTSHSPEVGRRDNLLKLSQVNKLAKKDRPITGRPDEGKGHAEKDD